MVRGVSKEDTIYGSLRKVIGKNVVNESSSMRCNSCRLRNEWKETMGKHTVQKLTSRGMLLVF